MDDDGLWIVSKYRTEKTVRLMEMPAGPCVSEPLDVRVSLTNFLWFGDKMDTQAVSILPVLGSICLVMEVRGQPMLSTSCFEILEGVLEVIHILIITMTNAQGRGLK